MYYMSVHHWLSSLAFIIGVHHRLEDMIRTIPWQPLWACYLLIMAFQQLWHCIQTMFPYDNWCICLVVLLHFQPVFSSNQSNVDVSTQFSSPLLTNPASWWWSGFHQITGYHDRWSNIAHLFRLHRSLTSTINNLDVSTQFSSLLLTHPACQCW